MSDFENKKSNVFAEESVDDILAGILNSDGTFNDEFNGLLKKYVGGDAPVIINVPASDISDRRDEPVITSASRIEYEEKQDISFAPDMKTIDERIEEKIPEIARDLYAKASAEAQRPEFTSTGDVKYPAMGVGEAEERVVFDADWEETAKKEAARLERVRQDRMLRGDSPYARSFNSAGTYVPKSSPYIDSPDRGNAYIDPVSDDDDFENMAMNSQYYSSSRKPFFQEGFSATQKNNSAAGGKTEKSRSGSAAYYRKEMQPRSDVSWLQVEEKPAKKKRGIFGKKNTDTKVSTVNSREDTALSQAESFTAEEKSSEDIRKYTGSMAAAIAEEIGAVENETRGLRSTVAEIVDKYNKRTEEDERKRLEEQVRLEDERRREELRERRRLEEIKELKDQMSPEVFRVVEIADADDDFGDYEDFSNEPSDKGEAIQKKNFGVVFNPDVFDDGNKGIEFTERITPEKIESILNEEDASGDRDYAVSEKQKTGKKNRRKDS